MNNKLKNLFFLLLLLAIVILFFLPFLTGENIPYAGDFTGSDLTELNLPFRFLATQALDQGEVPLWTNLLATGFPILAEGEAGVFYPFNLILFGLLPFPWAINISFILIFFLAGLFTYLYCRSLNISQFGSLLAAVAFSLSGFFIFRLKHFNLINAALWLPLIFYLIEKYFLTKRKPLILIALSFVFAFQLFAGFPPVVYISLISAFLYFCLKIIFFQPIKLNQIISKVLLPWLILGILIFGLAAIQLIPTLANSSRSSRSLSVDYSQIVAYPYPASNLAYFVSPYALGNPATNDYPADIGKFGVFWESNIYFGLIPLALSLLAIIFVFRRNKNVKLLTILLIISWLFIFGDASPLFIIFWKIIPGLQMFRFPQRFLLLALVCLTVLAGFGFDWLFKKIQARQKKFKQLTRAKLLVKVLLPLAVILIVAIDLYLVGLKYIGVLDYDQYFSPPQSVEFLKQDPDIFRVYSIAWPAAWHSINQLAGGWQNNLSLLIAGRELIPPNLNVFWGIASAQDRGSLEGGMLAKEQHWLSNQLMLRTWMKPRETDEVAIADQTLKVFGLQNVKYFLSFLPLANDNLDLVKEINIDFLPSLKIYQNQMFLPLAYGVFESQPASTTDSMLGMLFDENFDPATQIILAHEVVDSAGSAVLTGSPTSSVAIIDRQETSLVLETNFSETGYLFLSQAFAPGWQASLDGAKTDIIRANYAYMAVKVPAGPHQIVFAFKPLSYIIGKSISIITIIGLLIFLLTYYLVIRTKKNSFPI